MVSRFTPRDERLLPALGAEARRLGVVLPGREGDVPEVRELGDVPDHLLRIRPLEALGAEQLVGGDAARHRAGVPDCLAGVDEDLLEQAHAVARRAAVLVATLVVVGGEEVLEGAQAVGGVDVDEVEPGLARPQGRRPVPAPEVAEVALRHRARLHGLVGQRRDRHCRRSHRHLAPVVVGAVRAVVGELDPGEGAELVDPVRDPREHRQVTVVPDAKLDEGGDVGGVVDLDLLGAHHRPAALRLDPPHPGERGRVPVPHAVAVRDLVEAVLRGHRADRDRLEEHVVAGVSPRVAGWHHHRTELLGARAWKQTEPLSGEVVIQCEGVRQTVAAHQLEARAVDEGQPSAVGGEQGGHRRCVRALVYPERAKHRYEDGGQCPHRLQAEAALDQRE